MIARIAGGEGISAQSVRAILALPTISIPEVNATAVGWGAWLTHTSGSALGNALVELSKDDNGYGVTADVMNWIIRYFREIAAAPEAKSPPFRSLGVNTAAFRGWRGGGDAADGGLLSRPDYRSVPIDSACATQLLM